MPTFNWLVVLKILFMVHCQIVPQTGYILQNY